MRLLLLLGLATCAWAQATASISGAVVDPFPARMPGAQLRLHLGDRQMEAVANDRGEFRFEGLLPGTYTLEATARSFFTTHVEFSLKAGETKRLPDLPLTVAVSCLQPHFVLEPSAQPDRSTVRGQFLRGVVGGAERQPLVDLDLRLTFGFWDGVDMGKARTDDQGRFQFELLQGGPFGIGDGRTFAFFWSAPGWDVRLDPAVVDWTCPSSGCTQPNPSSTLTICE